MTEAATQPLITDAMKAEIGKESEPWTLEVDTTMIRMFARAVGHTDPVYYDEAEAKKAGYRGLPTPPGYLGTPVFNPGSSGGGRRGGAEPGRPLKRVLNGGTVIEQLEDICAGDVLTATSHVASYEETRGSIGEMLITTNKTVYKNHGGKTVAISTGTGIRY
jgi:acyl dehydratase